MTKDKSGENAIASRDGASFRPATAGELEAYHDASAHLAKLRVPVLHHANNPNELLYLAAFDGTGNDAIHDPEHATNVALISDQANQLKLQGMDNVLVGYEPGIGTSGNRAYRGLDMAYGLSYERRIEEQYYRFCTDVKKWLLEHPDGKISVFDLGFSRGGEQAAGFSRLVDERGVMDPNSRVVHHHLLGHDQVEYKKNLVPPGTVPQVAVLFDPVGTGEPWKHDRRFPDSMLAALQLNSMDRRSLFRVSDIVDQGFSRDGRFLGLTLPGSHSNDGGSYRENGLSSRSGNLAIDMFNAVSDKPILSKLYEPTDPAMNVVHASEKASLLYRLTPTVDRRKPEGHVDLLTPKDMCGTVPDCRNAEPVDRALDARFQRHAVPIGPVPALAPPAHPLKLTEAHPSFPAWHSISTGVDANPRLSQLDPVRSDNLKAGLLAQYEGNRVGLGMTRVDHVVSNQAGDRSFLIQGGLQDPAHRRMAIDIGPLLATPASASLAAVDAAIAQRPALVPEPLQSVQQQQEPHPVHHAPVLART